MLQRDDRHLHRARALGEEPCDRALVWRIRDRQGGLRAREDSLAHFTDPKLPYAEQKERLLAQFSRLYLTRLLKSTAGNQSEAARVSGLERSYLGKLLAKLDVPRAPTD